MKSKLYILYDKDSKVYAISEYKNSICCFLLQNNFNPDNFTVSKVTDIDTFNTYAILYEEYMLIEYDEFIIRKMDKKIIEDMINDTIQMTINTISNLHQISDTFDLKIKEIQIIDKAIDILRKNFKERLIGMISVDDIIRMYFNTPSIQESMAELISRYNFNINKD